jgi:Protein of unknown function (DUF1360)
MSGYLSLLVDGLATYRLQKLVRDDKITEDLRNAVFHKFGEPHEHKLSYLVTCPWCLSLYAGLGLSFSRMIAPKATNAVARALALSAIAGIMAEREDLFLE